jgi:CelD/BcsL family acetyltransferase involved in cellulose biosynthesis
MMNWTIVPASEFATYVELWKNLNRQGPMSPLLEPEFVEPLLAEFGNGKDVLAICKVQQQVVAMAIMSPVRTGVWETFQRSQAPIAMWINLPGCNVDELLGTLMRKLPGMPLAVGIPQRDPFLYPRPANSATLQTIDYIDTARITVAGTFDDYWAARGKNLRANLKKQRARMIKEGIVARMDALTAPEDMAEAVAQFGRLESAGWKAQGGTAIHPDNAQGRFYRSMLEGFCRRGAAVMIRYFFNDQLVAMDLCIESYGIRVILKTTYDETVPSHYSPAFLMREESCKQMFAEKKFERLEFYGKVMEWHLKWTDEVRTLYHVNSYRWPILLRLHTFVKNRPGRQQAQPLSEPAVAATPLANNHSSE